VTKFRGSAWTPWTGLFAGAVGWFAHQQAGAGANYWNCRFGGPLWVVLITLVSMAIIVAGATISWRARRTPEGEDQPGARRFAGLVGAATALIFLLAVILQAAAGLIVPACG
jgi:hypothetical protein